MDGRPDYYGVLDEAEMALWDAAAASAVGGASASNVIRIPENAHAMAMYAGWVADALVSERRSRFTRPE